MKSKTVSFGGNVQADSVNVPTQFAISEPLNKKLDILKIIAESNRIIVEKLGDMNALSITTNNGNPSFGNVSVSGNLTIK